MGRCCFIDLVSRVIVRKISNKNICIQKAGIHGISLATLLPTDFLEASRSFSKVLFSFGITLPRSSSNVLTGERTIVSPP